MTTKYWLMAVKVFAICRSPKASYRVSSIALAVMPIRDAVGRSITRLADSPLFWASLLASVSIGSPFMASRTLGPHWFNASTLSLWIVYCEMELSARFVT